MSQSVRQTGSIPVSVNRSDPNNTTTWNGAYITMTVMVDSKYYEIAMSWIAYKVGLGSASLWTKVTVNSPAADMRFFPFFYEHFKGDYHGSFQGFHAVGASDKRAESWNGGAGHISFIFTATDWTVNHEFGIQHKNDQSQCGFFIDGANVATNYSPYVSSQPFDIESAEVDGVHGTLNELFPPGITLP